MDFGTLLHMAKQNSQQHNKPSSNLFKAKLAPPKKETKESKRLSENIQKFLAKREQEDRERERQEKAKLNRLLALRDEKSKNKIRKMLKVTKSANKSVLDDVKDSDDTAVTLEGPDQADQDDYGYVSNEANVFYQKYIEKVKNVSDDKDFAPSRPQSIRDLSGTKERVRAAIRGEVEDKGSKLRSPAITNLSLPSSAKSLYDPESEKREEERKRQEEKEKKAKNRRPPPPPMDFQALLKLAEQKQREPVAFVPEPVRKKEPERLLTSKEKRELEERQKARERKEREEKEAKTPTKPRTMEPNGRIPKLSNGPSSSNKVNSSSSAQSNKSPAKPSSSSASDGKKSLTSTSSSSSSSKGSSSLPSTNSRDITDRKGSGSNDSRPSNPSSSSKASSSLASTKAVTASSASKPAHKGPTREFPPRDLQTIKPRQFPPPDVQRNRQYPDLRRPSARDNYPSPMGKRRRIYDDEDEDEYDSDLADFIDDGGDEEDYSSHIKAIFGYDKSKYRYEDDEDAAMESNFAQVQREEYISKKIGIQEDLEDMRQEALEKRRKMMAKKRR